MLRLPPGIHAGVPMADYLADCAEEPSLSASTAHTLLMQSPQHVLHVHPRLPFELGPKAEQETNDAATIGSLAHALFLERDDSKLVAVDAPDWRTKAARQERDSALAAGLLPVLAHREQDVRRMVERARAFVDSSEIVGAFRDGAAEQTLIWQEEGIWCRARPDWLTIDGFIVHYKTTQGSAEPNAWIRSQLVNMGYDISFAFYLRGLRALSPQRNVDAVFFVQEATPPYACSLVGLAPSLLDLAERKVERAISRWRECLARNDWPSYSARIHYAEALPWHETDFQARDENRAFDALQAKEGLQA